MEARQLAGLRHDLKNVLTALKSGCMLIESSLGKAAESEVREYLQEMRAELDRGSALLERLKELG